MDAKIDIHQGASTVRGLTTWPVTNGTETVNGTTMTYHDSNYFGMVGTVVVTLQIYKSCTRKLTFMLN